MKRLKLCEFCVEQPAAVLCAECCRCYCDECNKGAHELMKKSHNVEAIPKCVDVNARCPLHKDVPLELFCLTDTKLCCSMCKVDDLHKGHNSVKVSSISDKDILFSEKRLKERFESALKHGNDLEKKITETIEGVQKENVATKEKVSQSFKEAHERLNTEEIAVMKELEIVCNETEDALQKALNSLREMHDYVNEINDDSYTKRGERGKLMELNVVSEIEKRAKMIEKLCREKVTDLSIGWNSEKRKLFFTRNLISEFSVPENVTFSNVSGIDADVSWSCKNEEELSDEDKKDLLYCVEIKIVTENEEKWEEVYRGKDKKCSLSRLEIDAEYNVRVKCVIRSLNGEWSNTSNFRTKNIEVRVDSIILSDEVNGNALKKKLCSWCGTVNLELIYRGSRNGFGSNNFHSVCNNKGKTLVLIKNTSGHVFGGFASVSWDSSCSYKQAPGSFLFTLTNMYGIQPIKFPLKNENDGSAVEHDGRYGPTFGSGRDIIIYSNCAAKKIYTNFPNLYEDTTGKGHSIFSSSSNCDFKAEEIEVFRVSN